MTSSLQPELIHYAKTFEGVFRGDKGAREGLQPPRRLSRVTSRRAGFVWKRGADVTTCAGPRPARQSSERGKAAKGWGS